MSTPASIETPRGKAGAVPCAALSGQDARFTDHWLEAQCHARCGGGNAHWLEAQCHEGRRGCSSGGRRRLIRPLQKEFAPRNAAGGQEMCTFGSPSARHQAWGRGILSTTEGFPILDLLSGWEKKSGGNADLPQISLKARAHRNSLIINAEVISHNHFPPTRPEKRFSPLISRHRTRVTGLQQNRIPGAEPQQLRIRFSDAGSVPKTGLELAYAYPPKTVLTR